jgi:hypothetical protein
MRMNGSLCHLSARSTYLPQENIMLNTMQVPPIELLSSMEAHLEVAVLLGATSPVVTWNWLVMYGTNIVHPCLDVPCCSHQPWRRYQPCRLNWSTYDALESSHRGHGVMTGLTRLSNSPHSEPVALADPHESTPSAPRPRSSSAALDRRDSLLPQVSCLRLHCFAQWLTWTPPRYSQFHLASHGHKRLASCVSSREPSPESRASLSLSRSPTNSPHVRTVPQISTVASPHDTAASVSNARMPIQAAAFINSMPGDTHDAKIAGLSPMRRQTPPARKRKASEMLGAASPGSEERAVSPEPSESEAKKKYKKKMNVRHYRAQNKDAMTQLRDALPEHMRPPERQAKAYVTLSGAS